jgi:hypothetical protein
MQFSMSSISIRTRERMQFGKRADHQPLRSTVKRTLKCGAAVFSTSARCSSFPSELAMEMGAGPYAQTPACVFGPRERVVRAEYRPAPITFPFTFPSVPGRIARCGCDRTLRLYAQAGSSGARSSRRPCGQGHRIVALRREYQMPALRGLFAALRGVASRRFSRWRAERWWAPKVRTKSVETLFDVAATRSHLAVRAMRYSFYNQLKSL